MARYSLLQSLKRRPKQRARVRAHHLRRLLTRESAHVGKPYESLDADRGAYPVDQAPQLWLWRSPAQGREGILNPCYSSPAPERQALTARRLAFQRQPQLGTILRLVLDDPLCEALGHDCDPFQRVFRWVCSKQRVHLELWEGGGQQRPAIGEVAIRCGAAN